MNMRNGAKLLITVGGSLLAGIIGSVFTTSAIPTWYATLVKPELSPPNWIFGPVWTTLYILMGIAAFLIWSSPATDASARKNRALALTLYCIQLVLNTLWSIIFFGLKSPGIALGEITLLWVTIAATIIAFGKISKPATWLLVPYILWVSFAGYLNYAIWMLNSR